MQINYFYFLGTVNSLIVMLYVFISFPMDCINQDEGKILQANYSSWVSFLEEQRSTFYIIKAHFPCLRTYLESG